MKEMSMNLGEQYAVKYKLGKMQTTLVGKLVILARGETKGNNEFTFAVGNETVTVIETPGGSYLSTSQQAYLQKIQKITDVSIVRI